MPKLNLKPKHGVYAAITAALISSAVLFTGPKEGLRLKPYYDQVGVLTDCYGETQGVTLGHNSTKAECDAKFGVRLKQFAEEIQVCLPPQLAAEKPKVFIAFLDLAYNIGSYGFCHSSVATAASVGNLHVACERVMAFNKAGGRYNQGLANRREAERNLCLKGLE